MTKAEKEQLLLGLYDFIMRKRFDGCPSKVMGLYPSPRYATLTEIDLKTDIEEFLRED